MPAMKISELTPITGVNVATGDLFPVVDVSDNTMAASGTNKSLTAAEIARAVELNSPLIGYMAARSVY